ncbi:MAG: bifunctional 4-hydroxy-2-oxoglutarate aldolase/2-dehydro-3-deoxy-phosphogluconate aldolase [Firmicutes bacterium]|nr:bifunctional 4-hydroxy-2-oxoglutarate aldolase/2-dehydro-3-deoxy-phosphogluconate aldolase [Bacillota bacterium]
MEEILNQIGVFGIVPVVRLDRPENAVPLGRALLAGGLPCAEITFRTEAAEESIRRITAELPEMLIGAGTVLTVEQAKRAVAAGARFIVTPGFNPPVVQYCIENNIPITPGVSNPSDIDMALGFGLKVLKFFPAEVLGGLDAVKAISAAYGMVKFIPTGGVNTANLNEYLSFPKVHAVGGSWMVKPDLIVAGNFEEITRLTREAVQTMLGFTLAHVGINTADADEALKVAKRLCALFNFPLKEGNSSNFAGTAFEVMKGPGPGTKGHIAIQTNYIHRAIAYLERNGIPVDMSTAREANGVLIAVYLKEEVAGFALHLLQKR